jgi:hypothetical protein
MKSARAEVLRLIFPLLLRGATVDFFGTDDFLEADDDLVEVLLGFDDCCAIGSTTMKTVA